MLNSRTYIPVLMYVLVFGIILNSLLTILACAQLPLSAPHIAHLFLPRERRMGHLSQPYKKECKGWPVWGHHILSHHRKEASFLYHQHHCALHPHQRVSYICLLPATWSRSAHLTCFDITAKKEYRKWYTVWRHKKKHLSNTSCLMSQGKQFIDVL